MHINMMQILARFSHDKHDNHRHHKLWHNQKVEAKKEIVACDEALANEAAAAAQAIRCWHHPHPHHPHPHHD